MKNNNFNWRAISTTIAILVIVTGVVTAFVIGQERQKVLKENLTKTDAKVEEVKIKTDQNREDILVMQTDITYIKGGIKTLLEK